MLQTLINGLFLGGIYACVGVGFSLVWGVMNIINLTHGAFIMLGAYITYWSFQILGLDPFLSIPLSMVVLFFTGAFIQKYILNLVVKAPLFMTLVLTFGIELLMVNLALLAWTGDYRVVSPSYSSASFLVGPISIPIVRLGIFIIALLITVLLYIFMSKTKIGNAIRATRMHREAAQMMGIRIDKIYILTFGIGAAIAGAAGSLLILPIPFNPVSGIVYTVKAFLICVLGGLGNMFGALIGALALGLLETFGSTYIGPSYQNVTSFIVLIILIILSPSGLLGKRYY